MSKNAVAAYEAGEMPKSKWTKRAILEAISGYCFENDLMMTEEAAKLTKAQLFEKYIEWSSWHHTSKFANETDFYALDEEAVERDFAPMTDEQIEERNAAVRAERERIEHMETARREAYSTYLETHGFRPDTVAAYADTYPERVTHTTSKKGAPMLVFGFNGKEYRVRECDADHNLIGFNALEGK